MQLVKTHRSLRGFALTVGALLVALACGTTQGAPSGPAANVPGVTDSEILLGTTQPLSGAASAYASISKASTAYFNYLNDKGGINGRKITYKVYDDGYDPAKAVPLVRQLVTQDNVFAVFNELGTPVNLATRDYLNQQKVPDLFVATGSSHWGADYKQYPFTTGYQPDYVSEGKIYAKDILKNHPNAKIGILYQNDDYGKDYVNGLKTGLADKATSMVIDAETYEANAADVNSQVASIKSKGADLFFIVATPKFAAQALAVTSKLSWKPALYLNGVSNQVSTVLGAIKASAPDAADGATSVAYIKDPADKVKWGSDAGMKLYYDVMGKYCAGCDAVNDTNYIYGMSVAWALEQVLRKAGKDGVNRDNIMKLVRNMSYKDSPFLLPGISIQTSGSNQFPITQEALEHWQGTAWTVDSNIINAR
jgi:branched-chain amino acid transport system substrate-binding protein